MIRLQTVVDCGKSRIGLSQEDRILLIGSCFADTIGEKLLSGGFNVCINPFGTLYNPLSIANSLMRIASGLPFTMEDCVEMGAGAGKICSYSHHTSFARPTAEEFLQEANSVLAKSSAFFKTCNKIMITLGTAWCFRHTASGETVSNCLKRPQSEFERERLSLGQCISVLSRLTGKFLEGQGDRCPKRFILTVSPIRHMADGARGNQLSKSTLLLACEALLEEGMVEYFPSYEIMMDELRDYRYYAADLVHPSEVATACIWERLMDWAVPDGERAQIEASEKLYRQTGHESMRMPRRIFSDENAMR